MDYSQIALFAVCAFAAAAIVEGFAVSKSRRDAKDALGFFRYSKLTPRGKKAAARVCRVALEMGRVLGANPEQFARTWMADWWERLSVDVELPPDANANNQNNEGNDHADS